MSKRVKRLDAGLCTLADVFAGVHQGGPVKLAPGEKRGDFLVIKRTDPSNKGQARVVALCMRCARRCWPVVPIEMREPSRCTFDVSEIQPKRLAQHVSVYKAVDLVRGNCRCSCQRNVRFGRTRNRVRVRVKLGDEPEYIARGRGSIDFALDKSGTINVTFSDTGPDTTGAAIVLLERSGVIQQTYDEDHDALIEFCREMLRDDPSIMLRAEIMLDFIDKKGQRRMTTMSSNKPLRELAIARARQLV
jgi:hypothetical protein